MCNPCFTYIVVLYNQLISINTSAGSFSTDHPRLSCRHCIASLWQHFGVELQAPRIDENLVVLSDVLFNNEESPLPSSPEDGLEWLSTFMGPSIRFEMLGLLFTFFGLAYMFLQDTDALFDLPEIEGRDRKQISWRMKE